MKFIYYNYLNIIKNERKKITIIKNSIRLINNNSSIDIKELNKFQKLSTKWWKDEQFLPLRNLNQLRVPLIVDLFQSKLYDHHNNDNVQSNYPLKNIKLLDIGCGGGLFSESLARLGANMYGIDPVEENIFIAKNHSNQSFNNNPEIHLNYQAISIEKFSEVNENQNSFDAVIASEVLEHVDNIKCFLNCSINCIRSGGFLIITTINQTLLSYLITIFFAEYVLGLIPRGTHEYSKFIPPSSLTLILNQDFNCDVIKIHGMFFNPITYQWSWTQDQSLSYALIAKKR